MRLIKSFTIVNYDEIQSTTIVSYNFWSMVDVSPSVLNIIDDYY